MCFLCVFSLFLSHVPIAVTGQTINCPSLRLNGDIRQPKDEKIIKANAFVGSNTNIRSALRLNRTVAIPCYKGALSVRAYF